MNAWLSDELINKIKSHFEPKYNRKLSDAEVYLIADNLTEYMEALLKFKCKYEKQNKHA